VIIERTKTGCTDQLWRETQFWIIVAYTLHCSDEATGAPSFARDGERERENKRERESKIEREKKTEVYDGNMVYNTKSENEKKGERKKGERAREAERKKEDTLIDEGNPQHEYTYVCMLCVVRVCRSMCMRERECVCVRQVRSESATNLKKSEIA
jgi:hypothetical protein